MNPQPKPWTILGFLMALCFISHFNRVSMAVAADERIMSQYGISPERMGIIYSTFLVVYTVAMIPGGLFIDRVGPRRALILMGFGSAFFVVLTGAVGLGLFAAAQVWWMLFMVRSLMGLVTTPLHPGSARAVALWFPPAQRALANGLVTGAALLGISCTYTGFGWLIDRMDWPAAFFVCAAATALLTAAWQFFTSRDGTDRAALALEARSDAPVGGGARPPTTRAWSRIFANRSLMLLTLSYAAVGYFQYLFFYWMHYYFDQVLDLGKDQSRIYAGLPTLAMALCMPLGGWLCDRVQNGAAPDRAARVVAGGGMLLSGVFLAIGIGIAPDRAQPNHDAMGMIICFILALGALGLSEGPFWLTAVALGGRNGGASAAVMNTGGNGIGLLAPLLTPFISRHLGWQWGIGLGAVVAVLGACCWLGIKRTNPSMEAS